MKDDIKATLMIYGAVLTVLAFMVTGSLIQEPEKYEIRYIEGVIKDVEVARGGYDALSTITIYFEDGTIVTFRFIDWIFVVGEKYNITYEFQPKSPYAKFKIINIEHLDVNI